MEKHACWNGRSGRFRRLTIGCIGIAFALLATPLQAAISDRQYLADTATPGGTMTTQGVEASLACLHPEFVERLSAAIKDAREQGLIEAGIFSACRPPFLGVGGFRDKFNSLHAYGLAVDMHGIGRHGSSEAKLWHRIARKHGITCPYGPYDRAEWNHCQPTKLRMVRRGTGLRDTITRLGPIELEPMWRVAASFIATVDELAAYQHAQFTSARKAGKKKGKRCKKRRCKRR